LGLPKQSFSSQAIWLNIPNLLLPREVVSQGQLVLIEEVVKGLDFFFIDFVHR
jgi:hypothetical protein